MRRPDCPALAGNDDNGPIATAEPTAADLEARRAARRYPERPIVAVLAVVLRADGTRDAGR